MNRSVLAILILSMSCHCPALRAGEEESEWKKVDAMKPAALKEFVETHPDGAHVQDAKTLLLLHNRMADFRNRTNTPQLVIPIPVRGDADAPESPLTGADLIGVAFIRLPIAPGVGVLAFRPFEKGQGTIALTGHGPDLTARDGSIMAIKTCGLNTKEVLQKLEGDASMFGGFHFMTPETTTDLSSSDGVIFFGMIKGIGLVHLYGNATVISPDGRKSELKE